MKTGVSNLTEDVKISKRIGKFRNNTEFLEDLREVVISLKIQIEEAKRIEEVLKN